MADHPIKSDGEGRSSFSDDSSLPEDLLIEILSLLPVKSLLRFNCVCKSWLTMFKTPAFVSQHLTKVTDDQRKILAMGAEQYMVGERLTTCVPSPTSSSLNNLSRADSRSSRRVYKILSYNTLEVISRDLSKCFTKYWELLGIHNGVACFFDRLNDNIEIWNLAMRTRLTVDGCTSANFSKRREYAFGYDFETDAYNVIRITSRTYYGYGCEVYNVSTDSWSKRDALFPDGYFLDSQSHAGYGRCCVNGVFSMLIFRGRGESRKNFLLTFDMSNEVSIITPILELTLPSAFSAEYCKPYLIALNSSVALINMCGPSHLLLSLWKTFRSNEYRHSEHRFEIFALNEYGPNGTWIKMYTIGSLHEMTLPLGFRDHGNLLLLRNWKYELVLWDLEANEPKKTVDCGQVDQLTEYKESLVSLV